MYVQISILFDSKHIIIFLSISLNIYVLNALKNHRAVANVSDCRSSSILAQSHTFGEIGHEIISTVILSYKRKYVQEVLVACSGKKCG